MKLIVSLLFTFIFYKNSFSQEVSVRKKEFLIEKGFAISGYDAVSYFSNKPQKGKKEFSYQFDGIKYQFSNATNRDIFIKNPNKYEPQYGGWCAYAMGNKGEKVEIDPETYKILNGKLYLFFHPFYNNTLTDWNKDEKNLKSKADINWGKYIKN